MKTVLEYVVDADLDQALNLADEVYNETGMTPVSIRIKNGVKLKYNQEDIIALKKAEISIDDYIKLNIDLD